MVCDWRNIKYNLVVSFRMLDCSRHIDAGVKQRGGLPWICPLCVDVRPLSGRVPVLHENAHNGARPRSTLHEGLG